MKSEYLKMNVGDGVVNAFVVFPDSMPAPVVVVLHEVFGVNDDMRASCRELAQLGFIAVAPDLFWRQEPGVDLSHWTPAEWEKGLALYSAYDRDKGARDIADVLAFSRSMQGSTGKVGVMGYCLGGLMTYLVAARHGSDASVAYYPGSIEHYLGETASVAKPMIVHLAEEDEFISKQAQFEIRAALLQNPNIEVFSYPGCSHAFARHSGLHYDSHAAALANERTWGFLQDRLK